ncbi:FecR domain-containing protein [Pelagibacteraceae bacterium]|nr:FecR domain-containing protein [Pelagibacteraceae bacterium]
MKKTNFFHMNNINTSFKKIYFLLILVFSFFLTSVNTTYSEEKIGSIVTLKEEVFAINADGEKRLLDLYDEIFLQDEILTNELSSTTVQYNDNSTIIIKKSSSFKVTDFNITGLKNIFLGEVQKGSVIIESGKIAKEDKGSMVIELPKMTLGIKGTRFNIENNPDGTSEVSLAEDSFGNVGTINIASAGKVKTLFDTEQVISTNTETGFSERPKTDDEKKELVDVSNDLIEASSIDENVIQKNLEEKLLSGNLQDANGDGIIDESDISVIKEGIKLEKQGKIDFIVNNSTGENTEFLSQVLNQSDETSIGQSMDKIFESNNDLLSSVITNLVSEDNTFLTTSNSEANNAIKEKIYAQMLNDVDGNNNNIALIGNIISKSDVATVEKMVNFVEISDANNEGVNLSLQILSSVADGISLNEVNFGNEEQSQVDRLMEEAVFNAANSEDGAMLLANIMSKGSEESVYMMMDTIGQVGETFTDSTLALEVLSSMAENESFDDMNFEGEGQDLFDDMMEDAVFSAVNSDDGAIMLANMMANGSEESMGMMMETIGKVGDTFTDSTLALEVLSSMADNESFDDMNFEGEGQDLFDDMMEDAVFSAVNSDDGASMLASVMTNSDADTVGSMLDYIADVAENDPNSTFAAEVLSEIATTTANTDTYFDEATMNQFSDLVDTVAYTDTATDDAAALALTTATLADDDAAAATTATGTTTTDDTLYDAAGFAFAPPYYHKDTGTMYNNAGFDKDGNEQDDGAAGEDFDENGFSMDPPYYHKDTNTMYNNDGFDKFGNSSGAAGEDFDENGFSTVTPFNHNVTDTQFDSDGLHRITRTAYSPDGFDEDGNEQAAGEDFDENGFSTVTPFNHNVTDTQFDSDGLHRITRTAYSPDGFDEDGNEQAAGEDFDENGFSTVTPFNHNVTDTQFDSDGLHRITRTTRDDDGYNSAGYNVDGFNRADQWNASYDENDDVSGA